SLTGIVRAKVESPMAFRVSGQIAERLANAGDSVKAGQVIFRQDPSDNAATLRAAQAEKTSTAAALTTALAETARQRELFEKGFISKQFLDRTELSEREAKARANAAQAQFQQAKNASNYNVLRAPAKGLLLDVTGEPGQVVAAGQAVAVFAEDGEREVEVFFPDRMPVPEQGEVITAEGKKERITLIEKAGALDAMSRTQRARYKLVGASAAPALGGIVQTRFAVPALTADTLEVPLAALDERGKGPRVWLIKEGKAQPMPVLVTLLSSETARIRADFPANTALIVLGTHLLKPGMAVRELAK
ncbi:MAG: efflux RND transporter periplasmic adaptor subunit, partial [Paraperlucidibaca sp.]